MPSKALESPQGASFAALMELYENNYIYLRRLAPQLDGPSDTRVSRVCHGPDLHLAVTERFAYTTELQLTHRFGGQPSTETLPDLTVRVYHDARVAEVVADTGNPQMLPTLAWRWVANRFLQRWLRYCLGEGHAFAINDAEAAIIRRPHARRWAV